MGDISELQAKLDKAAKEKEVNGSAAANNTGTMMVRHWSLIGSKYSSRFDDLSAQSFK